MKFAKLVLLPLSLLLSCTDEKPTSVEKPQVANTQATKSSTPNADRLLLAIEKTGYEKDPNWKPSKLVTLSQHRSNIEKRKELTEEEKKRLSELEVKIEETSKKIIELIKNN